MQDGDVPDSFNGLFWSVFDVLGWWYGSLLDQDRHAASTTGKFRHNSSYLREDSSFSGSLKGGDDCGSDLGLP